MAKKPKSKKSAATKKQKDRKLRATANKIGEAGEKKFDARAVDYGLLANKIVTDYGIDFICFIDEQPGTPYPSAISGVLVAVSVRATKKADGRIKLDRSDADYMLRSDSVTMVALVHLKPVGPEDIYVRVVDADFRKELAAFLRSDRDSVSFTPAQFEPIDRVRELLAPACVPGFAQQARIASVVAGLEPDLPGFRLRVEQTADGSFTVVTAEDFFSLFGDTPDEAGRDPRFVAAFGAPDQLGVRMRQLEVTPALIESLNGLPSGLLVHGTTEHEVDDWVVSSGEGEATLELESINFPGQTGWRHRAGWSLVISKAVERNGQMVHELQAFADPGIELDLREHPDLDAFLRLCSDDSKVGRKSWPKRDLDGWGFADLPSHYLFASALASIRPVLSPDSKDHPVAFLRDAADEATRRGLWWLSTVIEDTSNPVVRLGFMLREQPGTPTDPCRFTVPVLVQAGAAVLIAELTCRGMAASINEELVGIQIQEVESLEVHVWEDAEIEVPYPLFVFDPNLGVQLDDDGWNQFDVPSELGPEFRLELIDYDAGE